MTDILDIVFGDDEARVIRVLAKRIDDLEKGRVNSAQTGMILDWGLVVKSAKWSLNRTASVSTNFTRWWRLNDINLTNTYEEMSGLTNWLGSIGGSGSNPVQGQMGGLTSEGSYGVRFGPPNKSILTREVATGARDWTIEAIFQPASVPQNSTIFGNGIFTGQQIMIQNGSGGSGSKLCLSLPGVATYDTGVTLGAGIWYHAIFVSNTADNTLYWYLGSLNPITKVFAIQSGSMAVGAAVDPASNAVIGGSGYAGVVGEALVYDGVVSGGTALYSAEDRIRNAVMPHAPSGWVPCDGVAVGRNRYDRLFRVYGTTFGAGNGSTTFNLPNYPGAIVKF